MSKCTAIVLAAGKGTRINASPERNKVTYHLGDKPMIQHSVENLRSAGIDDIIVVVGFAQESVKKILGNTVKYAVQQKPIGTGDALKSAMPYLNNQSNQVISVYGDDSAFYPPELIEKIISDHKKSKAAVTLLTLNLNDPTGLGRIIRDEAGNVTGIIEEKNASPAQKKISEINTGLYCFDTDFLQKKLGFVNKNPLSGEYYLTDLIEIAVKSGDLVNALVWDDTSVWHGINTKKQLQEARQKLQSK